jgi:5S rRNA maturation endonuclease (ribonuclease M5)
VSTRLKEKEEKIQLIINRLAEEAAKGKPIIVEGKKDAQALCELGVTGAVLTVKTGGKSFLEATSEIELLGVREVILLLDFDRRGKEGTKRLRENLERAKIRANIKFWRELQAQFGREIQCIESLPAYLSTLQEKTVQSGCEPFVAFMPENPFYKSPIFCTVAKFYGKQPSFRSNKVETGNPKLRRQTCP